MRRVFYKQNDIEVRSSFPSDVDILCHSLRKSDEEEIWASHNLTPWDGLHYGMTESLISLTITSKGKPIGMFGIRPDSYMGEKATIWFLASDELDSIKLRFLKHSKRFVKMFLSFYPYLYNYVDTRNKSSIEWLKFCGANIQNAMPYGVMAQPFHYFYFER